MQKPIYETVDIDRLIPNSWNSNFVSAENEERIRESIRRNGLFKPIIVRVTDEGLEIIGGQHRWEQAKALGYTNIPIVNLGAIDDKKAKEIGVIDNARYGADDALKFADILSDIGTTFDLQEFLPYGESDLNAIFAAQSIDLDELDLEEKFDEPEELPEVKSEKTKPTRTHDIMRFKVSLGDAERLAALVAQTQRQQGFSASDDLTNAGDALIYLLSDLLPNFNAGSGDE